MTLYNQEVKNKVREQMLGKAITALTTERHQYELIDQEELSVTFNHFLNLIGSGLGTGSYHAAAKEELRDWMAFDASCNTSRKPGELKVLYLCGPSPANDLRVLLDHGINVHNVWAVTGSTDGKAAHKQLSEFNLALKIHEGSLAEFFTIYNEVFDLIYFDACGPFMGGKPSTLNPLMAILDKQRLSSKGALISNYSGPPTEEGKARERYANLSTAYFHPRYDDIPDALRASDLDPAIFSVEPDILKAFVADNLDSMYSDLVTNLTIDMAMVLVPNLRTFSMPAFLKKHSAKRSCVEALLEKQSGHSINDNGLPGDRWLSPSSYPILSFVDLLEEYNANDPLLNALKSYNRDGLTYKHFIGVAELTKSVLENNWEILSDELLAALRCSWFDYRSRLTCDLPFPNLLTSSIVGTYGRPYFYNAKQSYRVKYTAKVQEMYCDLFLFDQCRSFFDWFPTVQACPTRFKSIPFQIVARSLIDRLGWANFCNTANPYRGSAIAGMHETAAAHLVMIPDRISIT